ncbi:MND1-interacting protein 1 [Coffea arabica]|uniref:MND1-interacting protein 1 n=1 Tax=Coffea arabica TaxID=13443 RepID=A0A6P6VIR1_COFAR|nr:MND1-interacting protein 1-like [Coffea arabica]
MAGSRKGKHKKKKEKSNPHISKENNKKINISDVKSELGHEKEGDKCDSKHTEDKQVEQFPTRLRNYSEEQINEIIFSLEELIQSLEQQLNDRINWILKKRREAKANMVSHTHELMKLSSEKEKREQQGKEKEELKTSMSKMMLNKEKVRGIATGQLDRLYEELGKVQAENLRLRAELTAIKLNESESKKNMKPAVKKEKEGVEKIESSEKHISKTKSLIIQEKEKILQQEVGLKNVVQAQGEAKLKFKQEMDEKEQPRILVLEEKKPTRIATEDRDRKLSSLEQELETERRCVIDDKERRMLEASHLKTQHLLASGVLEAGSSQNLAQAMLIPDHGSCIVCCKKEVSVLFMPCSHQVVCFNCSVIVGEYCPSCRVQIDEKYKIYGGTS